MPGTFYMLPKNHSEGNPGSPTIFNSGILTEELSGFIETILKQLVTQKATRHNRFSQQDLEH